MGRNISVPGAQIPGWRRIYAGKIRDLYVPATQYSPYGPDVILQVSSDRISVMDHVQTSAIPDKGKILTALSKWWFSKLSGIVPHHFISADVPRMVAHRAMITARLQMFPLEFRVRGYLAGSAYPEYTEHGTVAGVPLPPGLELASKLPEPIVCPSIKGRAGGHDIDIPFSESVRLIGEKNAVMVRENATRVYKTAAALCAEKGLILADTKLEFGISSEVGTQEVVLGDEVLTPDSSRYWLARDYCPGKQIPGYDRQIIRDWLMSEECGWDSSAHTHPPVLPREITEKTRNRYLEVMHRLTETKDFL